VNHNAEIPYFAHASHFFIHPLTATVNAAAAAAAAAAGHW